MPEDVVLDGAPCEGIVLVFDLTDEASFNHLECWQSFLKEHDVEVRRCPLSVCLKWYCFLARDLYT